MNIIFSYNVKKTYAVENVINLYRNKYGIGYNTTVMNSSAEKKINYIAQLGRTFQQIFLCNSFA